jgi:hypothetical protein
MYIYIYHYISYYCYYDVHMYASACIMISFTTSESLHLDLRYSPFGFHALVSRQPPNGLRFISWSLVTAYYFRFRLARFGWEEINDVEKAMMLKMFLSKEWRSKSDTGKTKDARKNDVQKSNLLRKWCWKLFGKKKRRWKNDDVQKMMLKNQMMFKKWRWKC